MDYMEYSSLQIIQMIKKGSDTVAYQQALAYIYEQNKKAISAKLSGGKYQLPNEVVEDIYHQGIVVLVRKIQLDELHKQNIPAYLWGVCKHLFLQYQDKNIRTRINKEKYSDQTHADSIDAEIEEELLNHSFRKLADQVFQTIGEKCRKILLWRQMNFSYREIARKLNPDTPSSDDVMRVLAGRCTKRLIKLVKENPGLKKQIDELLM